MKSCFFLVSNKSGDYCLIRNQGNVFQWTDLGSTSKLFERGIYQRAKSKLNPPAMKFHVIKLAVGSIFDPEQKAIVSTWTRRRDKSISESKTFKRTSDFYFIFHTIHIYLRTTNILQQYASPFDTFFKLRYHFQPTAGPFSWPLIWDIFLLIFIFGASILNPNIDWFLVEFQLRHLKCDP